MESVWYHNIVTKMLIIFKKVHIKKIVSSQISLFHLYKFLKDIVWNKTFMKIIHTWLSKLKFLNHTSIKSMSALLLWKVMVENSMFTFGN